MLACLPASGLGKAGRHEKEHMADNLPLAGSNSSQPLPTAAASDGTAEHDHAAA